MRKFDTGATRDSDEGKPRYGGFFSPLAMQAYGEYMHQHRIQPDGSLRDADNWKKGIPDRELFESAFRHFEDWWLIEDGYEGRSSLREALCALIFNAQARLHSECLKEDEC